MLKALLKKQFLELNAFYFQNKKTGKQRSKAGVIGYIILFAFIFLSLGATFYGTSYMLADALIPQGLTWLYFVFMSGIAIAFGTFGSVFNTFQGLYQAKDNDLLLSMPIPPSKLLFVRMVGVFTMGLLYETLVMVPALVAYFIVGSPTSLSVIFSILLLFIIAFFVLSLTCFLGFIIASISSKLKNKSFITVFLCLVFIGAYYFVCMNFSNYLNDIIENSIMIGKTVKNAAYPLYLLGRAAEGSVPAMLFIIALVGVLFAITYFVLSVTFMKIATKKNDGTKVVYREKTSKASDVSKALFLREWKRFSSSANYMMNCGLGVIFMIAGGVAALIFESKIRDTLPMFGDINDFLPIIVAAAICMISSMNDITAPSISLEGKNLWIIQSMPVDVTKVFDAKQALQNVLTIPAAVFLTGSLAYVCRIDVRNAVLMTGLVVSYNLFMSSFGLAIGLKKPNLSWTNEIVPIKQGMPVAICLFGGWLVSILIGIGGYFGVKYISTYYVLLIGLVIFATLVKMINRWLKEKGVRIFEEL